ncbi:flagellar filament capping protein FliD [Microbacterium stercoris]|uniref:Flagellar hook-associated protein 2 n=1 Tax=Microbacterium stercoris TaxID=2820289 RepID=A0A939QS76_9MICO|nr:flagellar filament capping protein FliD [Microbacterium stercoris]MBO3664611.1 flagellar filament capping protein FliD [Microbacterium stercoris]
MGISLDGLVSGLGTAAMIDALMDVEAIPRTLLQNKIDDRGLVIKNLQSLNTSLQDLVTQAQKAGKTDALAAFTATSSSDAVKVTATSSASPVATSVVVDRVATAQTVVTAPRTSWPTDPPVLTVVDADGVATEIRPSSTSMTEVARAINAAGAGVTASAVAAGVDSEGKALYRLQLTATETGSAGAFQVHADGVDLATEPGAATITTASDAQVRLWAGTAAEQTITSSSNTFTNLLPGVDLTVVKASADPVAVTVAADPDASAKTAGDFVKTLAALLSKIDAGSKATVAKPGENTTLGVYTGDSTVRSARRGIADAVQFPVDGVSPSTIGISIDRYGVLTFDATKFKAALADDPASVQAVFGGIAKRVETVADTYSDKYDGLLTARITGQEREVTMLEKTVDRWDVRLDMRRASLERTYARMETMLSQMNSQAAYLTSQLASLAPSTQEK